MSRDTDLFRGLRDLETREAPKRRRKILKPLAIIGIVLVLALASTAAAVWMHVQKKFEQTHDASIEVDPELGPGSPMNVLVLGSDRRDVVDPSERGERQFRGGEGQRADTIILVHVSGDRKRAVLVHFPRDLRVDIPGQGTAKINAAYAGGPNLMMKTIKQLSGLSINHYVEINFSSFRNIVDAVGGVNMCVDRSYHDRRSGLEIPKPGCYDFDGNTALSFVRARYVDPDADFGRIRRQQMFMRTLMSKVTSLGFIANFPRVLRLSNAVSKGVVTDKNLSLSIVRQIANRLSGFQQRSLDFRVVPGDARYVGDVSYVIARDSEAKALFAALAADEPKLPPYGKTKLSIPDPQDVLMTVLNGTKSAGLATREADRLRDLGYKIKRVANAPSLTYAKTVILYRPGAELMADLVQDEYPEAERKLSTKHLEADVVLIIGADVAARSPPPSAAPS